MLGSLKALDSYLRPFDFPAHSGAIPVCQLEREQTHCLERSALANGDGKSEEVKGGVSGGSRVAQEVLPSSMACLACFVRF